MTAEIRAFAPEDFEQVVALARQTLELPSLDAGQFARDFLLAPGFRPEHLLVAEAPGRLAGFVLAPRNEPLGGVHQGWIAAFGVAPGQRRRGIGTALLGRTINDMRDEGITAIDIADVPVRYLLPGVDRVAFPAATALLTVKFGFTVRDEVASMGIDLDGRQFPTAKAVRPATPGEYPLVRAFLDAEFDAGWWAFLERSIFARLSGDPTASDVLCWFEHRQPLGCVHYRGNRFGPLAVSATARGRGIGAALTVAALAAVRAAGEARAHFLIGREEVQPFYARLGFEVLRRFSRLRLEM